MQVKVLVRLGIVNMISKHDLIELYFLYFIGGSLLK